MKEEKTSFEKLLDGSLIFFLTLSCIFALASLQQFLGNATYHAAPGGTITEIVLDARQRANYWFGAYGIAASADEESNTTFNASGGHMLELYPKFACLNENETNELYALNISPHLIDWENVYPANASFYDTILNLSVYSAQAAQNTFTDNMSIILGIRNLTGIPAVSTYQQNNRTSKVFMHGLLTDGNNIIIVSKITNQAVTGFNGNFYNYQMFVPVPFNTNVTYYLTSDPLDSCIVENNTLNQTQNITANISNIGYAVGFVYDNSTGLIVEGTDIYIGLSYESSDSAGFYNISLYNGTYKIIALKEGYYNYVRNITIIGGNTTYHNITLRPLPVESNYTNINPKTEDKTQDNTKTGTGSGVDIGPNFYQYKEPPKPTGIDHFMAPEEINKKIRLGNFFTEGIVIYNFKNEAARVSLRVVGNISEIIDLSKKEFVIGGNSLERIVVTGLGKRVGTFIGNITLSGAFNGTVPVKIVVTDEDKLPVEALLMELELLTKEPYSSSNIKFAVNLHNMLIEEKYNVTLKYTIRGINHATSNYTLELPEDTVELLTSKTVIKEIMIPENFAAGDYGIFVNADYLELSSQAETQFTLKNPVKLSMSWLFLLALIPLIIIIIIKKRIDDKKRFNHNIDLKTLPKKGDRSLYLGKIADSEIDAYFQMDKLTTHAIIAGSTGSGKTIAAQVIAEECLLKGSAVIVFDPTAQWSGFLRKCEDKKMISYYPRFHFSSKDVKAFSGNIRAVKNPLEKIDLSNYMKPGEINIFTLSTLSPKDMDIFVANTVSQVFHSNLPENSGLKTLIVYDEVHRLLPKFGGHGDGFIQIERACREFRKFGIGLLLVSQVLSDFIGEIKANINTEIQMKTRDEGDLKRVRIKYGKENVQPLVKATTGAGMIENTDYNSGKPYFIVYRPILHSTKRLSDEELSKYNKYNEEIDELHFEINELESEKLDVFELRLEVNLALNKVKEGHFQMVEIYLEELRPKVADCWKKIGKLPAKKEDNTYDDSLLKKDIAIAKKAREEYEHQLKKKKKDEEQHIFSFGDSVSPYDVLHLGNDIVVLSLQNLYDEIFGMNEESFSRYVNNEKNVFSDWIKNAIKIPKMAEIAEKIRTKTRFIEFLEKIKDGTWENYAPAPMLREEKKMPEEIPKEMKAEKKEENASKTGIIEAPPESYFKLYSGGEVKSISELSQRLLDMPANVFYHHVNQRNNDFANWINDVFMEKKLALKIRDVISKDEMKKIIDEELRR